MIQNLILAWRALSKAQARALLALGLMLVLAQIGQPYPSTAWLHHLPTALLVLAAPLLLRRWPLSDGTVVALALFFALHTLGGRWTYSNIPYDGWAQALTGRSISDAFGWERNHYDRLVHFAFGALVYGPVREFVLRYAARSRLLAALSGFGFIISVGALYEMLEWLLTLMADPEIADDYNGQQGDMWDAQKDMALALLGAVLAAALIRLGERRRHA